MLEQTSALVEPNIPIITKSGLRLCALSPKYLHTNSTSHTWPFSAIAELVDNAYDPDVRASRLLINIERVSCTENGELFFALTFTDNGAGMDPSKVYKMLSFGFCEKEKLNVKNHKNVGYYGNGFKSGSMRLGKDAAVFTKTAHSFTLGLLSQTYLEETNADAIVVPIVSWSNLNEMLYPENDSRSLDDILKYSPFKSMATILNEFSKIESSSGTRIVIWNLRQGSGHATEFDFDTDVHDLRIPEDASNSDERKYKREERQQHIPACDYSLRAYLAILYLKPKMQIFLRGRKVKTVIIAKSLTQTETDLYRPVDCPKPVKITFGFSQNVNHYGIMMYYRNRLIKPYVRVGYQLKANQNGVGVVGVIQTDFLQPTHNKQDFNYTPRYRATMAALGTKLNDYWHEKVGDAAPDPVMQSFSLERNLPDVNWVQCDNLACLKWRRLPDSVDPAKLPDKWYCKDHPDPIWRSCSVPAEEEDDDEVLVSPYVKIFKRKRKALKKIEQERSGWASVSSAVGKVSGSTSTSSVGANAENRDRPSLKRPREQEVSLASPAVFSHYRIDSGGSGTLRLANVQVVQPLQSPTRPSPTRPSPSRPSPVAKSVSAASELGVTRHSVASDTPRALSQLPSAIVTEALAYQATAVMASSGNVPTSGTKTNPARRNPPVVSSAHSGDLRRTSQSGDSSARRVGDPQCGVTPLPSADSSQAPQRAVAGPSAAGVPWSPVSPAQSESRGKIDVVVIKDEEDETDVKLDASSPSSNWGTKDLPLPVDDFEEPGGRGEVKIEPPPQSVLDESEYLTKLASIIRRNIFKLSAEELRGVDGDIIDELKSKDVKSVGLLLARRTQHLRDLQNGVLKLLACLLDGLELPDPKARTVDSEDVLELVLGSIAAVSEDP